jgi:MFS family permease
MNNHGEADTTVAAFDRTITKALGGRSIMIEVRFFLGVCEAGFFPGMILYFTYWFPARCRGQVVGWFMTAIPVAI